ncbi:hypothetical protein FRC08_002841 [Ceratobasidium sp. 394]|nr:hypothetical protein FRC08_002841 [Ceratobasidium sp. 394]
MAPKTLTDSDVIVYGRHTARCLVCLESGNALSMNRKSLKRHVTTNAHIANLEQANANAAAPVFTPSHSGTPDNYNLSAYHPVDYDDTFVHTQLLVSGDSGLDGDDTDSADVDSPDSIFDPENTDDLFMRLHDEVDVNPPVEQPPDIGTEGDDGWETESDNGLGNDARKPQNAKSTLCPSIKNSEWCPFPSKAMYLADALCHSRRVHFGRTHIKALLEYARETQGEKIPSYDTLRKFQRSLKARIGDPSKRYVSSQGTVYHINEISEGLKQDMANPHVRPHMNFYPHVDGKKMSQAWHGHKMVHDLPDNFLTPCALIGGRMFYVNELVRRQQDWFIPLRWITFGSDHELYAVGHRVLETPDGLNVLSTERKTVRAATFLESFPELQTRKAIPVFDENSVNFRSSMPHPLRTIAGSRPVYSVPLIVFMDDASGNVSKQWNKHWSCYLSNAALPREELQSEYNVRFVATSSHASPSELMEGIRASIETAFNNPTLAYDCVTRKEVLVRPFALFWAGDNPMQAEHCSSSGLNSSYPCRTCEVGGTDDYKQSLDGYRTLFTSGNRRDPCKTQNLVDERLDMAIQPKTIQKVKNHMRDTGVKDPMAQPIIDRLLNLGKLLRNPPTGTPRRSPQQIEDILQQELAKARSACCINPLLTMPGVNIHRDTPTEILHTVLLGVVKYFWGQSVFVLDKAKKLPILESRLASINISGLDLPRFSASYICQYRGSLIGKHFKAITQVMSFICYDILPAQLLEAWLLLGRLTCLLWYTTIEDINSYTEELQAVIDDFLLVTAQCSPSIIILKPKFHFLIHLPMYIRRFGPAILFSTERFESFNGVFRAASTFSNRQAPSRDIARRFGDLDRVKHISSGGYWYEGDSWTCASDKLLNFASTNKIFSQLIGMPNETVATPGSVVLLPKTSVKERIRAVPQSWGQFVMQEAGIRDCTPPIPGNGGYFHILSTVAAFGDTIRVGNDILSCDNQFARVQAIFGCALGSNPCKYFVAVQLYALGSTKHHLLDLPVLTRTQSVICIPIEEILCAINLQHDCARVSACSNTYAVYEVQERELTTKVTYRVKHSDDDHFILNLHGFHNARIIRKALPDHLYARRVPSTNVEDIFNSAIEKLSVAKLQKIRLAAAKKKAKGVVVEAMEEASGHAGEEDTEAVVTEEVIEAVLPNASSRTKRKAPANTQSKRKRQKS